MFTDFVSSAYRSAHNATSLSTPLPLPGRGEGGGRVLSIRYYILHTVSLISFFLVFIYSSVNSELSSTIHTQHRGPSVCNGRPTSTYLYCIFDLISHHIHKCLPTFKSFQRFHRHCIQRRGPCICNSAKCKKFLC